MHVRGFYFLITSESSPEQSGPLPAVDYFIATEFTNNNTYTFSWNHFVIRNGISAWKHRKFEYLLFGNLILKFTISSKVWGKKLDSSNKFLAFYGSGF